MKKNILEHVVAIIPARGGSKRLPRKNIYPFNGKPMIGWTIEAAKASNFINDVYVTSEDKEILNLSKSLNSKIIKRPNKLSDDKTFKMEAIKHAVLQIEKTKKPTLVISLQANSPEIKSIDIDRAIDHLIKYNLNEVISVDHNLVQNGAIRAMKYETVFLKTLSVYLGVIKTKIADIHTLSELKKTEKELKNEISTPKKALVIVAHQDDETIGCGGTLYKWAKNGCEIDVIFVTDGQTGIDQRDLYDNKSIKGTRMEEAKMAADVLQLSQIETLNVPCQRVDDKSQDLFHTLIKKIRLFKPEIILTHSSIDKHRDHKAVSRLVKEASWKSKEDIHSELGETFQVGDVWGIEITDLHEKIDFIVSLSNESYNAKIKAFFKIYFTRKSYKGND